MSVRMSRTRTNGWVFVAFVLGMIAVGEMCFFAGEIVTAQCLRGE